MAWSRVGTSLRSARQRAGWSREELAYRSGLSFGAIAQIESGRRREVRLGSLLALANALGVSVDYLVGFQATVAPQLVGHTALLYGSDEEYIAAAAGFVLEGIARADRVLVVTASRQTGLLRDTLGDRASQVEFQDSSEWYRLPGSTLDRYRSYIKEAFGRGAAWVRIVGEPLWASWSESEVTEWAALRVAGQPVPGVIASSRHVPLRHSVCVRRSPGHRSSHPPPGCRERRSYRQRSLSTPRATSVEATLTSCRHVRFSARCTPWPVASANTLMLPGSTRATTGPL